MLRNYSHIPYTFTAATARFIFGGAHHSLPHRNTSLSPLLKRHTADLNSPSSDGETNSSVLSITPQASERLKLLLERRKMEKGAVQLSVREKGCAGLSYTMDFHHSPSITMDNGQSAILVTQQDGYSVIVDRKSLGYLLGCEIDWLEGDVSSQFVFKNPNATHNCPCGRSFAT